MCQRFEDEVLLLGWRRLYPRASVPAILGFETEAADRMRAYAARQGIGLVDLAREMSGRKKYFADFVHFTDEGAGVVAALLAKQLLSTSPESGVPTGVGREH